MAYKAILDYTKDNNIKCTLPSREIYVKGSGKIFKRNPNNYSNRIGGKRYVNR
jgi:effector-binding domain-containing protein